MFLDQEMENQASEAETRCQFHKHFTLVTYSHNKMSQCILKTLHGSIHATDDQTYFIRAVSYECKMFMNYVSIS